MDQQLKRLQAKLDRQAIDQLRAEVTRLAQRVDDLEQQLAWASDDADRWQDLAIDMANRTDQQIGITRQGDIGLVK